MTQTKPTTEPLWYSGICDQLLYKIVYWYKNYARGEVAATRQFVSEKGSIVDKPTCYAHRMIWKREELDHLIVIIQALLPDSDLTKEIIEIRSRWTNGKMVAGGGRKMTIAMYPEHVKQILDLLLQARSGQTRTTEEIQEEQKEQGKELFEA